MRQALTFIVSAVVVQDNANLPSATETQMIWFWSRQHEQEGKSTNTRLVEIHVTEDEGQHID